VNLLITNAFSLEQKGDSALLAGTISQLKLAFPSARVQAQISGRTTPDQAYKGVPVMESAIFLATVPDVSKPLMLLRMAYVLAVTRLWAVLARVTGRSYRLGMNNELYRSCQAIFEADVVVAVAGGYLAGAPGLGETLNMFFIVLAIRLAHILGKPVVHYAQSIGPVSNGLQRWLVKGALKRAQLVITREGVSTDFALGLGLDPARVVQAVDVGFLFEPAPGYRLEEALEDSERLNAKKPLVGITSKEHYGPKEQQAYERELAAFADWICGDRGMQVVFIPQVTSPELGHDDRIINKRLYGLMKHKSDAFLVEKNITNHQTKSVIDQLDYMVGTRFHSVIFALTGYVPAIGLEYEHKTSGILRDLDMSEWMLPMRGVKAVELERLFDKLVAGRETYLAHLRKRLPAYLARAERARDRIVGVLSA
jgi:colanic acid/amylovoran biosynthesis protein